MKRGKKWLYTLTVQLCWDLQAKQIDNIVILVMSDHIHLNTLNISR